MKNVSRRWLALLILFLCVSGFAQSGPPPFPTQFYGFPSDFITWGPVEDPVAYTTNLISEPVSATDIWGNALILDTTNLTPAYLKYYVIDTNFNANLSYGTGTILFYFAPNWASVSQGGLGPQGQMLTISNASFETPSTAIYTNNAVDGWTLGGGSGNDGVLNTEYFAGNLGLAPDGIQAGLINGADSSSPTTISQTLTNTLQADSTYTLTIAVGGWLYMSNACGTNYSVSLYAGTNLLTSVTPVVAPLGAWTNLQATYTAGDSVAAGQNLEIVIGCSAGQIDFDNVQLSASPAVQQLTVSNYSFEFPVTTNYTTDGIPGWTFSGADGAGVLIPTNIIGSVPDGAQSGYVNSSGTLDTVTQTLTNMLLSNALYTLSIKVGGWSGGTLSPGTNYSISLYAGTNLLASAVPVVPPWGSWTNLQAAFTTGDSVPSGENLSIVIGCSAGQFDFDEVQLSVSPNPGENAYFISAGDITTNGSFGIYADAAGSNIYFGGVSNGVSITYASAPISWASNTFHQVGVEWASSTRSHPSGTSTIYLDGAVAATGSGESIVPWLGTDTNGFYTNTFTIGSDSSGYEQARGAFLDMYTWAEAYWSYSAYWPEVSNNIAAWQSTLGDGGFGGMLAMGIGPRGTVQTFTYVTNYLEYTNFWMTITPTNANTNALVTIQQTQSNLTYAILTNSALDTNLANWGVWQTLTASNSVVVAPTFPIGTNTMFFASQLVLTTGTNTLPDWWQMEYFGHLNVSAFDDPDGDGLCNYSEYVLGTNPTNANSVTSYHTDAQAIFLAYTNDTSTVLWLSETNGPGAGMVTLTLSNTLVGSNYQIYSKDLTTTNSAWRLETSFTSTNQASSVTVALNGRTLGFIGGDAGDPDGDGLPSGYEVLATHTDPLLPDTGMTGVPDAFKDPDGDGFSNLDEYKNGTDPLVSNTPAGPSGLSVTLNNTGGSESATVSWEPNNGSVSGYIILRDSGSGFVPIATNGASSTTYTDHSLPTNGIANYEIEDELSGENSGPSVSLSAFDNSRYNFPIAIVNGASNRLYLVVSSMPVTVTNFIVMRTVYDYATAYENLDTYGMDAYYPIDFPRWNQLRVSLPAPIGNGTFNIPLSAFTNGIAIIPSSDAPPYASYDFTVQPQGSDGKLGDLVDCWGPTVSPMFNTFGTVPFLDGTAQMKNNLAFLMRNGSTPFWWGTFSTNDNGYESGDDGIGVYNEYYIEYPSDYIYSSYFTEHGAYDQFMPFEDNVVYSNFQYDASFDTPGHSDPIDEGILGDFFWSDLATLFPTYAYASSGSMSAISPSLVVSNSQWFYSMNACGIYQVGSNLYMTNGAYNIYGLPYLSYQAQTYQAGPPSGPFTLLSPSTTVSSSDSLYYSQILLPALHTVGYYFARLANFDVADPNGRNIWEDRYLGFPTIFTPTTVADPKPGDNDQGYFDNTNTTPMMITPVGQPLYIAGYAKQMATNAYTNVYGYNWNDDAQDALVTNVFAYLGQYFTNALLMSNGTNTTNIAGIVSEYGSFFPTVAGQVALMTKPDPDQGNLQGQCIINVIGISVDGNHDGVLDESFTGPDFTSEGHPYRFWVNDNIDNGDDDGDGIPGIATNLADGSRFSMGDISGSTYGPIYQVHGTRDLVDYFPVHLNIGSVAQAWLTNAQYTNLEFRLSQADGALRFTYTSLTPTNYMDYLHDTNVAESLANVQVSLIPSSGVDLTNTFLEQIATNNQGIILVEAWKPTSQPLVLDILQNGNIIAETSLNLSISGVEQMFRFKNFTGVAPPYNQMGSGDRLTDSDVPNEPDTDDNNFIFVHGYNVDPDHARGNASDVFKRLYWAGSHAKFYGVSWRSFTSMGAIPIVPSLTPNYHTNVCNAFLTASNFSAFLGTLSGTNIVSAHSLGNMLVLSAINDWNAPISKYFMLDAAVPIEAIDGAAPTTTDMVYSDWTPYATWLYSHEWSKLWPTNDGRSLLSWQNRLANFRSVDVFNFYSSGEECLRDFPLDPPSSVYSALPAQVWAALHDATGSYVWVWEEKGKGRAKFDTQVGSTHGGWAFNDTVYGTFNGGYSHLGVSAASMLTNTQVEAFPFFDLASYPTSFGSFTADLALTNSGGSAYATTNQNRILADAIPAMTLAIGANPVTRLSPPDAPVQRNFNMNVLYQNGWPADRLSTPESTNWHHSDFKDVAYPFVYPLYTNFVSYGNLK